MAPSPDRQVEREQQRKENQQGHVNLLCMKGSVISVGQEPTGRGAPIDRAPGPAAALAPDAELLAP
jgi:hypothetical protein